MLIQILTLLFQGLFGRQIRPAEAIPQPPITPEPLSETWRPRPILDLSAHHAPTGTALIHPPQIIAPNPAHRDAHGPASAIARAMIAKGHDIFSNDANRYNLNIVAIRATNPEFDKFNDRFAHFYCHEGEWHMQSWAWTTLPGKTYMVDRLLSPLGCAILVPGQYRDIYRLDRHRGIYQALCQRGGDVRVYRDRDRDREYDMEPSTIQSGSYGINVHATENPDDGVSNPVADRIASASAGCLVAARVADFVEARAQWRLGHALWGRDFTATLIDAVDIDDLGETPLEPVTPQHSDPESWTPPAPASVGTRNRNLLNVKQGKDPWKYSTGKDGKGHTIFPNYAAGIRAAIITLRTYWVTHRLRTLDGITGRWAPSSDTIGSIAGAPSNQPGKYAEFLAKRTGIGPRDTLMTFHESGTIRSADQLYALVAAMVEMECGGHVILPRSVFDNGLKLI